MIAAITEFRDRLLGRGSASITVPVFDGALKANHLVEQAQVVAELDAPEDLATDGHSVYLADGPTLMELKGDTLQTVHRFEHPLTALACLPGGAFAVALAGREVRIHGGAHDGRSWSAVQDQPLCSVNAISVAANGDLLVTDASQQHAHEQWKHDLMQLGRTGRVVRLSPGDGSSRVLASGMQYAFGVCEVGNDVWASESWRHAPMVVGRTGKRVPATDELPGYPSRMSASSRGGVWLTCFTLRTQLVEFVLREKTYRKRMVEEIDPAYWIAPALNSGNTFMEPMQGAQLKMMGIVKPWAPPRSYGLVVRLDEQGRVLYSLHSRFDGKHHGIVAAVECAGRLYLVSKGRRRLLVVDIATVEKELAPRPPHPFWNSARRPKNTPGCPPSKRSTLPCCPAKSTRSLAKTVPGNLHSPR